MISLPLWTRRPETAPIRSGGSVQAVKALRGSDEEEEEEEEDEVEEAQA